MSEKKIDQARFSDTGYSYTLSLIAGKYKPVILYCLMEYEPVRFNEMQRYLGKVADKTLSQNLKRCWTSSATGAWKTGTGTGPSRRTTLDIRSPVCYNVKASEGKSFDGNEKPDKRAG